LKNNTPPLSPSLPQDVSLMSKLAVQHGRNGNPSKARDILERALKIEPSNVAVRSNLAVALDRLRDYDRSITIYEEVDEFKNIEHLFVRC
jgi:Flp pilus assembly protein TadD